jgi:hypothetical protein
MGTEYDAYDDGLQAWLTGNPGWPGWPAPQAPSTTLDVAVLREDSRLHERARELEATPGTRARQLLTAVRQELSA